MYILNLFLVIRENNTTLLILMVYEGSKPKVSSHNSNDEGKILQKKTYKMNQT